jgi:hypothetical protein
MSDTTQPLYKFGQLLKLESGDVIKVRSIAREVGIYRYWGICQFGTLKGYSCHELESKLTPYVRMKLLAWRDPSDGEVRFTSEISETSEFGDSFKRDPRFDITYKAK